MGSQFARQVSSQVWWHTVAAQVPSQLPPQVSPHVCPQVGSQVLQVTRQSVRFPVTAPSQSPPSQEMFEPAPTASLVCFSLRTRIVLFLSRSFFSTA